MKILFISCWYPDDKQPGKGIFVKEHAKAIKLAGNEIYVVHINVYGGNRIYNHHIEKYTDEDGLQTLRINIDSKAWKLIYSAPGILFSYIFKAIKSHILLNFEPDIIHSNVLYPAGILGDKLSDKLNKPHVISEHWSKLDSFFSSSIYKRVGRKAYDNASCIMPVSKFLKENLAKYVKDTEKIVIVPNVVQSELFNQEKKTNNSNTVKFSAIASWNITKDLIKRPDLIIKALGAIKDQTDKNIVLEIIGDGNQIPELKKLAIEVGLDTRFPGRLSKEHIAEKLNETDFFLHASNYETFSVVIAEALISGTPVIASNVCAIPELVNESNGILADNNLDSWIQAINKAMQNDYDSAKISNDYKDKFSYARIGNMINEIYRRSL